MALSDQIIFKTIHRVDMTLGVHIGVSFHINSKDTHNK